MRLAAVLAAVLLSSLLPTLALADDTLTRSAAPPVFATLSTDGSHGTDLGADASILTVPDSDDWPPIYGLRLAGTYLDPGSGAGGYATLSMGTAENVGSYLGNLEVGGVLRRDVSPTTTIAARVGLGLPTADDDTQPFERYLGNLVMRPSDVVLAAPDITSLRASVTPSLRSGNIFVRGELGIDVAVAGERSEELDPLVHLALAAGVSQRNVAGTLEYQVVGIPEAGQTELIHAVSLTAQLRSGRVAFYGGPGTAFADGLDPFDTFNLFIGLRGQL